MVTRPLFHLPVIAALVVTGCRSAREFRDPEFLALTQSWNQARSDLNPAESSLPSPAPDLAGPHAVDEYVQIALAQNPELQTARKRIEATAYQVPIAASLQDPMLNVTVQPAPVQTASGQQELILAASQKLPWFGKLDARASVAEAQTNVARAELAAAQLAIVEKVKRAYYELYFLQQAIRVTQSEQQLLREIRNIANVKYTTGRATQQDVLRADLEIANIENELIRLRQQLDSTQARLASLLHVPPDTELLASDDLSAEELLGDLDGLQRRAVAARPELHALLAAVERDQQAVELARLDYHPDLTVGLSWIEVGNAGISPVANGEDAVLLTAGINLPVYRGRLDSGVRSAEAKAVATARQYDSERDATLEQVTDLFKQARSRQDLLALFKNDILPKARQTLQVSSQAYNVGEVDFLQLIDNWRQLLRYEVTYHRLQSELRQTIASLERAVGGFGTATEASPATGDMAPASSEP